jgi:hypothetical protein
MNKTKEIQAFLLGFIWIYLDGVRALVEFAASRGSFLRPRGSGASSAARK